MLIANTLTYSKKLLFEFCLAENNRERFKFSFNLLLFGFDSVCIFYLISRGKSLQFNERSHIFFSFPLVFLPQRNKAIVSAIITRKEKGKDIKISGASHTSFPFSYGRALDLLRALMAPAWDACTRLNPSFAG